VSTFFCLRIPLEQDEQAQGSHFALLDALLASFGFTKIGGTNLTDIMVKKTWLVLVVRNALLACNRAKTKTGKKVCSRDLGI
jgi:hypothetical protein